MLVEDIEFPDTITVTILRQNIALMSETMSNDPVAAHSSLGRTDGKDLEKGRGQSMRAWLVSSGDVFMVLSVIRNPNRTSGIEHALMVPVGLATALVTGEGWMVLVVLDLFVMLKDKQGKSWNT